MLFTFTIFDILCILESNKHKEVTMPEHLTNDTQDLTENIEVSDEYNDETEQTVVKLTESTSYVTKESKYKDTRSSAFSFILIGLLGLIFMIFNFIGTFSILKSYQENIIIYTLMSILFISFIIISIYYYLKSIKLKPDVIAEENTTNEILSGTLLTSSSIDSNIDNSLSDELKYFERVSYIKKYMINSYPDLRDDYIEYISDKLYDNIFDE